MNVVDSVCVCSVIVLCAQGMDLSRHMVLAVRQSGGFGRKEGRSMKAISASKRGSRGRRFRPVYVNIGIQQTIVLGPALCYHLKNACDRTSLESSNQLFYVHFVTTLKMPAIGLHWNPAINCFMCTLLPP